MESPVAVGNDDNKYGSGSLLKALEPFEKIMRECVVMIVAATLEYR